MEKISPLSNSLPRGERIAQTKTCKHCGISFDITDKDLEFYEKVSPVFDGQRPVSFETGLKDMGNGKIKYQIPAPTFCPDCRQLRRLSWRNERSLYKRKCDATGRQIISNYSPDKPYKIYEQDFWWSDKWDAIDYGMDFDFGKTFFEQFDCLNKVVPHPNLFMTGRANSVNSEYINCAGGALGAKNCYLIFNSGGCEDCGYLHGVMSGKDCYDCYFSLNIENCYELVNCSDCYKLFFSTSCVNCSESIFLRDCEGCTDCIGCTNLKNAKYYIFNKQYSKSEYLSYKKDYCKIKAEFQEFILNEPTRESNIINSSNCTGDYIENSKDCLDCTEIYNSEDCKFSDRIKEIKTGYDNYGFGYNSELLYENVGSGGDSYGLLFTSCTEASTNNYYCVETKSSKNCFGCIGLRSKSYCIFNKQYSKEEYELMVPKIITHMMKTGEWGEFFPSSISPFGYNETVMVEYYPYTKQKAIEEGLNWSEYESPQPKVDKVIAASKLPSNINDVPDDILNWAIECEQTKKPFRIIPAEMNFLRNHNLPIPKRHPDQRHLDRMKLRNIINKK